MKHFLSKMYSATPPVLLAFFASLETLVYAIGFLVISDIITGIWASVKAGQPISSDRLSRTVTKTIVYLTALIVAQVAGVYVIPDLPILKVISGIIAATELLSIYENLTRVSGIDFMTTVKDRMMPLRVAKEDRGCPTPGFGQDRNAEGTLVSNAVPISVLTEVTTQITQGVSEPLADNFEGEVSVKTDKAP